MELYPITPNHYLALSAILFYHRYCRGFDSQKCVFNFDVARTHAQRGEFVFRDFR